MARGVVSAPTPDRLALERAAWARGIARVGGIDEAGRGPLAGPVAAACVVLPRPDDHPAVFTSLAGLTDSKALSPAARERFFDRLTSEPAIAWAIGWADVEEIDRINILRATHAAMARAVRALPVMPDLVLVDGLPVPGLPCPSRAVVGGDRCALSVAAASVIAKVLRDRRMLETDAAYPGYGFARHKGYGTAAHLAALRRHGPCPMHRRSFAPVAALTGTRATPGLA